jgi:trigger factor
MDIKIEDLSSVKKKVFLSVEPDTVNEKLDEYFKVMKKQAVINGFRKGKIPAPVLRFKYMDEAKKIVSKSLITESYQLLLKDYEITPIGDPDILQEGDIYGKFAKDNTFSAEMIVEILPKVDPIGYDNVNLNDIERLNLDEMYEKKLDELQEQFAEKTQISEPIQLGDAAVVDFKGFLNGKPFNGGEATGFSIDKLGSSGMVEGLEEQIVGMTAGEERRITVKFPEDYQFDVVAGKETEFEVKLHTAIRSKRAELNEDLAIMSGYSTVDEKPKEQL